MAATAIYDPGFIEQYSATRYGPTTKGMLTDRSTRAYWDAAQAANRENASIRRAADEAALARTWEEEQNKLSRESDASIAAENRAFSLSEAEKTRQSNKEIADQANKGGLAEAGIQLGTSLATGDLIFNKGEGLKGIYDMAAGGLDTATEAVKGIPGMIEQATSAQAAQYAADSAVAGGQQLSANAGIFSGAPAPITAETATGTTYGANLAGGSIPVSADLAPAGVDIATTTTAPATTSIPTEGILSGGGAQTSSFSLGTTLAGAGVIALNESLKPLYEDTFGPQGTWSGDLGSGIHSAVRGAGTAAMMAGTGATAAIAGAMGMTGVGAPVAAAIIIADVLSTLPQTEAWTEAEKFIDSIPVIGPTLEDVFLNPVEWGLDLLNKTFGFVENIVSAPFKAISSWF